MYTRFYFLSRTGRAHAATCACAALVLASFVMMAPVSAQNAAAGAKPAASKPAQAKEAKSVARDYLVQVGKHVMWKSQVATMHPDQAKTAKPLSKKAGTDYLVQVGKKAVRASTLRRVEGAHATRPAPHDASCRDYLVKSGKQTVWASEVGAPCPAGPHKGEQKPLCCVASLETEPDLKPCCKTAHGK